MSRVLVALSGGVDSSVAAALLVEQGHEVIGVTMRLWGGESDTGCCSVSDVDDARRVAQQLGIAHHVFNFSEEFNTHVVDPYVRDHAEGRTPNPCVECNRHLKFDKLFRRANALGFDLVATGHHARKVQVDGEYFVARGEDASKDQSYVLYPLVGSALERTLFPLGEMTKVEVRALANRLSLRTANKAESQDVCFITRSNGRESFLSDRIPLRRARIVDNAGSELGQVPSIEMVTIGQRKGLDLGGGAVPRYVTDVDYQTATVTVGEAEDLLTRSLVIEELVWADPSHLAEVDPQSLSVQTSAHGQPRALASVEVAEDGRSVVLTYCDSERKTAHGQSAVIYQGDRVLAGGIARRQ